MRQLDTETLYWQLLQSGAGPVEACREVGTGRKTGYRWRAENGGLPPARLAETARLERYLSLLERQRIAALHRDGLGVRAIAGRLARSPSTVSRELRRTMRPHDNGHYDGDLAHARARERSRRPRRGRLLAGPQLRAVVQEKPELEWSPEQIAAHLREACPGTPGWHVCHQTICQALYHGGKGGLSRQLTRKLRTGRPLRKRRRTPGQRRARFTVPIVLTGHRPAAARTRAGDREGDLITGQRNQSAILTLADPVQPLPAPGAPARRPRRRGRPRRAHHPAHQPARTSTAHRDLGPGIRDGPARPDCPAPARGRVLRPPGQPVAARHEREHERPAAPVLPQEHQPDGLHPRRPALRRRTAQHPAPQNPEVAHARQHLPRRADIMRPVRVATTTRIRPSLLFGYERAKYLGFLDAIVENADQDAVLLPGGRGRPFYFDGPWMKLAAKGKVSEPELGDRIRRVWKTDLFLSDEDRHRHVAATIKSNWHQLEGGPGLRLGIVPEAKDLSAGIRRHNDLWLAVLPDPNGFMGLFNDAYESVAEAVFTLGKHERGSYFYKPTPMGQRLQQQLEGYGNAKVVEIEDALNEAAQQDLIGVETRLVSVDAPPWLHLNAVRTPVIAPKPTFMPLD